MSSDRLRENLDAVAEAAGGVARLRELILQLAVQGKLVEQDPKEEPARSLLARLGVRLNRSHQVDQTSQGPYSIPVAWIWTDLGNIIEDITSGWSPNCESRTKSDDEWGVLKVSAVSWGVFLPNENKALPLELEPRQQFAVQSGDFLMSRANTAELVGRSVIVDQVPPRLLLSDKLLRVSVPTEINKHYLNLFMASPSARSYLAEKSSGTSASMRNVSREVIRAMLVAVPPFAEQKRIVAKVDELMALCDELEQKQEQRHIVRRAAYTSALEALTNAQTPDELAHAWERLQKHWDVLAAHADAVPPLRQAILQLAVQGRLVAQNQDDEPAISLLSQIAGRHAAAMTSTASGQNELYLLPNSWKWARFDAIAAIRSNLVDPAGFREAAHIAPNHIEKGTGRLLPYGSIGDDKVTSGKHRFYAGQILYSKIRPNLSKAALVDFEGLCGADMYPIEPWIDSRYLLTFILSETFLRQVTAEDNRVAMPKVNQEQLSMVRVAVPPLAEQKRIVTRVDELMALCDSLEQRAREQEALASQLAHAAVAAVATG